MGKTNVDVVVDDDETLNEPTAHNQNNTKTNTSPTHKKPLTPTKNHPLSDLIHTSKPSKGEFMDDSDEQDDAVLDDIIVYENKNDYVGSTTNSENSNANNNDNNNQINNQISPETENQNQHQHHITTSKSSINLTTHANHQDQERDDEKNNNTQMIESDDEVDIDKQKLAPEKVIRRKKSPSRGTNNNNNNVNIKNNNRMSYPIARDRSQSRIEDAMTRSTDRIDGN